MSILIEDMEMPQNCEECDVKAVCKNYWKLIREQYTRPSWCSLIEVPEPHGKLIDADALAKDLNFDVENDQRALDQMDFVGKEREHVQFDKDCKQNCMRYLSEAPTIIPASEKEET